MKIPQFVKGKSLTLLYSILIILPSILTGNVYGLLNEEKSTTSTLSNLSAISTSIYTGLDEAQKHASYSLELLLRHKDFLEFNVAGMSKHISEFMYHTPTIKNVYIINQSHTILYGINDTSLSGLQYSAHVENALNGRIGFYTDFIQNTPFAQFAFPIFGTDQSLPHGALVVTYNFLPVQEELKALNSSSNKLNGYLFDMNGRLLASSSNHSTLSQTKRIDIATIRQGIDYDPLSNFTLFDDTQLLGNYYVLDDNSWTLLVTSSVPDNATFADIISWLAGFLSLGSISSFEFIRKKKSIAPSPSNLDTQDTSSQHPTSNDMN